MQQVEKIRGFLTGCLFFTVLDTFSLFIFLPILFTYSVKLALVTLVFTFLIGMVVMAMVPTFQRRLNDLYIAEGVRQSMMVETIHGMRTVKALAIEPTQRRLRDQRLSAVHQHAFQGWEISIIGNSITDFLGKLLPVVIIILGSQEVFAQTLSVGALIGFQMISGRG